MGKHMGQLRDCLRLFLMRLCSLHRKGQELKSLLRLTPFDASSPEGRSKERYRRIAMTALSSIATRGIGIATAIITTPLTLQYLGAARFGLWMTITSITALLSFADFGIGSGLLNAISRADGQNDRSAAQKAVSSAFLLLALIAALLIVSFAVAYVWIPWGGVFNLRHDAEIREASHAVAVLVACIAASLPLATVVRVQMGFQEGFESNLWQASANLATVVGVVWAALAEASLPWLVFASNGIPVLVTLLNWVLQFAWRRRWLLPRATRFDSAIGWSILRAGVVFAALQLVTFVGFFSDNFVITQISGPAAVAPYAIMYKLFSAVFLVQFIITPLWPALNEAIARGDRAQARKMFERATFICLVAGATIAGFLIGLGRPIVALWVGRDLMPGWNLLLGFGAWTLVASYFAAIAALLSGTPLLLHQLRIFSVAAVLSFVLKIPLVALFGISGAIWASVIGYGALTSYAMATARRVLE
jgi:O-antigen/teichoic acid export membrane protein